jgi:hypothetical protein
VASLVRARRSEERAAREVEGYEAQGV